MLNKRTQTFLLSAIIGIIFLNCQKESTSPSGSTSTTGTTTNADPKIGCTDAAATNFKSTATQDDCSCEYNFTSKVSSSVPSNFTQKIMIEEFTGTWCGWCPMGRETVEKISTNPAVLGVEIHYQDEMENLSEVFTPLRLLMGNPAFPTALVNRKKSVVGTTTIIGESEWKTNADAILKTPQTTSGIAIDTKLTGNSLQILTHLKFQNAMKDNYGFGAYLLEDGITGYSQVNYLTNDSRFAQYAAYKLPAVIKDAVYNNVARTTVSSNTTGLDIPSAALQEGKIYRKLFKIDLPTSVKNPANCKLLVFVINRTTKEIVNAQIVKVGESKSWD